MSERPGWFRRYLKFGVLAACVTGLLVLMGWVPTRRLAGPEGPAAMLAGCGISLAASMVGGLLVARDKGEAPVVQVMAAMGVRLLMAVVLTLVLALVGGLQTVPLLLWVASSYLALLVVDTRFAVETVRMREEDGGIGA